MSVTAFHPEDRSWSQIGPQLLACGWLVQSKAEMNLGAGLGNAVREFQTASAPIEYGLLVGRRLCGVIEAKPQSTTLSGFSEQAARYIADLPNYLVHKEGQVRFDCCVSGTEMLFRDHVDPSPASRRLFAFHWPQILERWLKEHHTLRRHVTAIPAVVADRLRACQAEQANIDKQTLAFSIVDQKRPPIRDRILNLQEVTSLLEVEEKAIHTMARHAEIPAFKVRRKWRFKGVALDSWIETQRIHKIRPSLTTDGNTTEGIASNRGRQDDH